jgi:hypothetical protein
MPPIWVTPLPLGAAAPVLAATCALVVVPHSSRCGGGFLRVGAGTDYGGNGREAPTAASRRIFRTGLTPLELPTVIPLADAHIGECNSNFPERDN